jgi:hypothetical protein
MKEAAAEDSPLDAVALREVLRASLVSLDTIRKEVEKVSLVGSRIAAGVFSQGTKEQRRLVCESSGVNKIKSSLEVCRPSLTHLFGDDETRIDKALEASKFSSHLYGQQTYRPKAPYFPPPPTPMGGAGVVRRRMASRGSRSTSLGREKAPALPPRRGRARRSDSPKGGWGGVFGLSVPSLVTAPFLCSLSSCPRPANIWGSGADCATSFPSGKKFW